MVSLSAIWTNLRVVRRLCYLLCNKAEAPRVVNVFMNMETLLAICAGLGLAAACGFRVFVPMLITSIAVHAGHLHVTPGMAWIGSTPALITFSLATALELGGSIFASIAAIIAPIAALILIIAIVSFLAFRAFRNRIPVSV